MPGKNRKGYGGTAASVPGANVPPPAKKAGGKAMPKKMTGKKVK